MSCRPAGIYSYASIAAHCPCSTRKPADQPVPPFRPLHVLHMQESRAALAPMASGFRDGSWPCGAAPKLPAWCARACNATPRHRQVVSGESWKAAASSQCGRRCRKRFTTTIMELYRQRWQIGLAIKRLESLLDLRHLPKGSSQRAGMTASKTFCQFARRVAGGSSRRFFPLRLWSRRSVIAAGGKPASCCENCVTLFCRPST